MTLCATCKTPPKRAHVSVKTRQTLSPKYQNRKDYRPNPVVYDCYGRRQNLCKPSMATLKLIQALICSKVKSNKYPCSLRIYKKDRYIQISICQTFFFIPAQDLRATLFEKERLKDIQIVIHIMKCIRNFAQSRPCSVF